MTLKRRIEKLEGNTGHSQPKWITLLNPDEKAIERARKQTSARLFIIDIGGPKQLIGLPPE
jgi:hypothetical protein